MTPEEIDRIQRKARLAKFRRMLFRVCLLAAGCGFTFGFTVFALRFAWFLGQGAALWVLSKLP